MKLTPRPLPMTDAKRFVFIVHRKRPKVEGGMWAAAVTRDVEIDPAHAALVRHVWRKSAPKNIEAMLSVVGVAIVARPAPSLDDGHTLNVARVACLEGDAAPNGNKGACSMLYGRCARVAKALAAQMYTYTEEHEDGASLRAAGWIDEGVRETGVDARPGRQIDLVPKRRWRAP